jgi:hypothetical protein
MRLPGFDRANRSMEKLKAQPPAEPPASVLVITRDSDLYAGIREIVSAWKWNVRCQTDPSDRPGVGNAGIVVLDGDVTGGNWKDSLTAIRAGGGDPCILLASRVFDPYLWDEVIRCGGFDVITRSEGRERLTSILRFAWFRKTQDRCFASAFSTPCIR